MPLINTDTNTNNNNNNNLYKINSDNFSYINENTNKTACINNYLDYKSNDDKFFKINNIIKINFICKTHMNNKYTAYCSICEENICQICLLNDTNHIGHKIYFLKDIIPMDITINYYQKLILSSRYYLENIRNIIIEIYNELFIFYENEKDYLIKELQKQLIKGYKYFYKKNYYQLKYAQSIINFFFYFKALRLFNYQIIQNFNEIKINSVKIPDLINQNIIMKAKIMIEFMIDNNNNILKSSDIDSYFDFVNTINTSDLLMKNSGVIYERKYILNDEIDIRIQEKEKNIREIISKINENKRIKDKEIINKEIYYSQKSKDKNYINIKDKNNNLINHIQKNITNDSKLKKYIYLNLPHSCVDEDEIEYKNNIQYLYFDKSSRKEVKCRYYGECKKNTLIRHGRGLFMWEDGEYYLGYWENDMQEGMGTNVYSNGNKYEGYYKNGKKEGKGSYEWKNGDIYIGDWKNDMKDGEGKYFCKNGDKYIGMFKMDKIEGEGSYNWANENKYDGQFKNNEIEGKGVLTLIYSNPNDIKDIHSRITYLKHKDKTVVIEDNNNDNDKLYDKRKSIEIITCDRNNFNDKDNTNIINDNTK